MVCVTTKAASTSKPFVYGRFARQRSAHRCCVIHTHAHTLSPSLPLSLLCFGRHAYTSSCDCMRLSMITDQVHAMTACLLMLAADLPTALHFANVYSTLTSSSHTHTHTRQQTRGIACNCKHHVHVATPRTHCCFRAVIKSSHAIKCMGDCLTRARSRYVWSRAGVNCPG